MRDETRSKKHSIKKNVDLLVKKKIAIGIIVQHTGRVENGTIEPRKIALLCTRIVYRKSQETVQRDDMSLNIIKPIITRLPIIVPLWRVPNSGTFRARTCISVVSHTYRRTCYKRLNAKFSRTVDVWLTFTGPRPAAGVAGDGGTIRS